MFIHTPLDPQPVAGVRTPLLRSLFDAGPIDAVAGDQPQLAGGQGAEFGFPREKRLPHFCDNLLRPHAGDSAVRKRLVVRILFPNRPGVPLPGHRVGCRRKQDLSPDGGLTSRIVFFNRSRPAEDHSARLHNRPHDANPIAECDGKTTDQPLRPGVLEPLVVPLEIGRGPPRSLPA